MMHRADHVADGDGQAHDQCAEQRTGDHRPPTGSARRSACRAEMTRTERSTPSRAISADAAGAASPKHSTGRLVSRPITVADMPSSVFSSPVTVETTTNGPRRTARTAAARCSTGRRECGFPVFRGGARHPVRRWSGMQSFVIGRPASAGSARNVLEGLDHQGMVVRLRQSGHGDRADHTDVRDDDREATRRARRTGSARCRRPRRAILPASASRRPTRYDDSPNRLTTRIFRSTQLSLSAVVPARAAWNS